MPGRGQGACHLFAARLIIDLPQDSYGQTEARGANKETSCAPRDQMHLTWVPTRMKSFLFILLLVCMAGCVGTRDSLSVIRGKVVNSKGMPISGCKAVPVRSGSNEPLSSFEKAIDSEFMISIVNAPSSGMAVLIFNCPGISGVTLSREIDLALAKRDGGLQIGSVVVQ